MVVCAALACGCDSLFGIGDLPSTRSSADGGVSDAGDAGSGNGPSFCDGVASSWFCADFDHGERVTEGWDDETKSLQNTAGGATLAFDEERTHSAPRAARMSLPVLLGGARALSHLQKTLPKDAHVLRIITAVRIETEGFPDDRGVYTFMQLAFPPAGGLTVSRGRDGTYVDTMVVDTTGGQKSLALTEPMSVGRWYVLTLLLTLPTSSTHDGDVEVLVDGIPAGTLAIPYSVTGGATPSLGLGMVGQGPMRETELSFDDVRIEVVD